MLPKHVLNLAKCNETLPAGLFGHSMCQSLGKGLGIQWLSLWQVRFRKCYCNCWRKTEELFYATMLSVHSSLLAAMTKLMSSLVSKRIHALKAGRRQKFLFNVFCNLKSSLSFCPDKQCIFSSSCS